MKEGWLKNGLVGLALCVSPVWAGQVQTYVLVEHPNVQAPKKLVDTFKVQYQQDEFTDKVTQAQIIYAPKDYRTQAAYFMRCGPYLSSFTVNYVENAQNLKEEGALPNQAGKFEKFGFVYNDNQDLTARVGDDSVETEVYVGGQTRYLNKHFKVDFPQMKDMLGMTFFLEFVTQDTPVETTRATSQEAAHFMELFKRALKKGEKVQFDLEAENGHQRHFSLDAGRMAKFIPPEVLDFCFFDRKLKVEKSFFGF